MKRRDDLLGAPEGVEIIQLTDDEKCSASHIYMEAQIFFPDSKRFVLHRSATAHGGDKNDPEHKYLLCDIENRCSLEPVTEETGATGPAVSPDGGYFYYFVNETETNKGRLTLKRLDFKNSRKRETIMVVDSPLSETGTQPSRIYPLSTIFSDGAKIAISAFFGDGETEKAPFGLMVFNIKKAEVSVVIKGETWCNMHPQYSRSPDEEFKNDILIQENHGSVCDRYGKIVTLIGGKGADIHVIKDDGTNFRTMPWGRNGNEFCQGHQCWRGRSEWAITSTSQSDVREARLIEGKAAEDRGHIGLNTSNGRRNDISKNFKNPHFIHFATDIEGRLIVSDDIGGNVLLGRLQEAGKSPAVNWTYLVNSRSSRVKESHVHPFLSPDGTKAFFNSDESGLLQAYMITGLENIKI
jgi:hypothetical protein